MTRKQTGVCLFEYLAKNHFIKIKELSKQNNTTLNNPLHVGRLSGREAFCTTHRKEKFGPAAATSDTCLLPQMNQEGKNSSFNNSFFF